jgi:hypothetical protein
MSKNHPHDNIYSILGKLDALKPTAEEKHKSLIKEIQASVEAKGSITEGVSSVESKLKHQFAESKIEEKAVSQAQQKFMGMVHAAQKGEKAASPAVAKVANSMGKKDARDFAATKHKGLPAHVKEGICNECGMTEGSCEHTMSEDMSRAAKGYEKYGKKGMQALAKAGRDGASEKKLDTIRDKHDQYNEAEECCCKELGQKECPVHCDEEPRSVKEGETIRKDGVTTHRKTDFPGYPVDEPEDIEDENKGKRGRPRKHAKKAPTGLGRGRPKKDAPLGANAPKMNDPFGRVPSKVPASKVKGRVHSMAESMEQLELALTEMLSESRLMDDTGATLGHIVNRFKAEVRKFEQDGDLDQDLYHALFDYYNDNGEMPYGVAKARDGDPYEWVAQNLQSHLSGGGIVGGNPDEDYGLEREGIEGNMPPVDNIPGKEDLLKGKGRDYYEEVDPMEEELNELARLAGLNTEGNAFTGKLKSTPKGNKFDLDGKEYTDTSTLDEEPNEGNAFGAAVARAKSDGIQPGEKVEVGGKEYAVKEAEAPVDEPEDDKYANEPHEKYGTIKQITSQGDDLNRQKKQDPHTANKAANPLTNSPTLESRLAAEYESIKKVSK